MHTVSKEGVDCTRFENNDAYASSTPTSSVATRLAAERTYCSCDLCRIGI